MRFPQAFARRRFADALAALALCAGFLAAGPVWADPPAQAALPHPSEPPADGDRLLRLGYAAYLGGLHVFAFTSDFALGPETYSIKSRGEPRGMLGLFWKWRVRLAAAGNTGADGARPQIYNVDTFRPKRDRSMQLSFDENGKYAIRRTPVDTPERAAKRKLPDQLPQGAIDPLSVAFAVGHSVATGAGCRETFPVFDGNRRYDLTFKDFGTDTLDRTPLSVYAGPAYKCQFDIKRISGFDRPRTYLRYWDEDNLDPPVIWVARVVPHMPPVPVRMHGDLNMGGLRIYLVWAEYAGKPLFANGAKPQFKHFSNN